MMYLDDCIISYECMVDSLMQLIEGVCCKFRTLQLAKCVRFMYDIRSLSTDTVTVTKSCSTGPGLFICGTVRCYNVDVHSVYLIWSLIHTGCNVSFNELNPSEVPSDSLFIKQYDSVSQSGESVKSVVIRASVATPAIRSWEMEQTEIT